MPSLTSCASSRSSPRGCRRRCGRGARAPPARAARARPAGRRPLSAPCGAGQRCGPRSCFARAELPAALPPGAVRYTDPSGVLAAQRPGWLCVWMRAGCSACASSGGRRRARRCRATAASTSWRRCAWPSPCSPSCRSAPSARRAAGPRRGAPAPRDLPRTRAPCCPLITHARRACPRPLPQPYMP